MAKGILRRSANLPKLYVATVWPSQSWEATLNLVKLSLQKPSSVAFL